MNETTHRAPRAPRRRWSWNDPATRALIYQVVILGLVALGVWYLTSNTLHNLAARNISTGFDFLHEEAGFAIGESMVQYSPADTYGHAVVVGLLNTLKVSVIGVIAATLFGTLLGISRLSKNWLISRLSGLYIEVMRNIPLLLQLFFWYALITEIMPGPRQALQPLPDVFVSNRGFKIPWFKGDAMDWIFGGLALAIVLIVLLAHWARRRQDATGQIFPLGRAALGLLVIVPVLAFWISGGSLEIDRPELKGFNFQGGLNMSPEFSALLLGLVTYTSAFVGEVVRSGIQAVNQGQWEAASSIGLSRARTLRLVILPQAMRVIIPPMTSQYLNLTKNSSLAIAVGYMDLRGTLGGTTLNQTGREMECMVLMMGIYLALSLIISAGMNVFNARVKLKER